MKTADLFKIIFITSSFSHPSSDFRCTFEILSICFDKHVLSHEFHCVENAMTADTSDDAFLSLFAVIGLIIQSRLHVLVT